MGKEVFPTAGWQITNGRLLKVAQVYGGDILIREKFTDFDFQWEWRIASNGNSGVKYIPLTDHRDESWFHNLKIRRL